MRKINHKAFTLVELIVVIAIIGVLSAILIPTMLGYVYTSRLTSINSIAANLRSSVSNWLLELDCDATGMKKSGNLVTVSLVLNPDNAIGGSNADMSCVVTNTAIENAYYDGTNVWNYNSGYCADGIILENNFEDVIGKAYAGGRFSAIVYLEDGCCVGVVVTDNTLGIPAAAPIPQRADFDTNIFAWANNDGVGSDGIIYGTSPALYLFD